MKLICKRLHPEAKLPTRSHPTDLGYDLYSLEEKTLEPGEKHSFHLGFAAQLPAGLSLAGESVSMGAFVWDKSSVGDKCVKVLGGVIEATYRGEWVAMLINLGKESLTFKKGQKLCQAVIMSVFLGQSEWVDELSGTERGVGGFGSTGEH